MKNKFLKINALAILLICSFLLVSDTAAQTARRKKRSKQTPVAAPVSQTDGNSQYLDGNRIVFGEIPSEQQTTEPASSTQTAAPPIESEADGKIRELNARLKKLESTKKSDEDQKQQRLLLNLDILTRAETRAESLRKQLFEMIEKENSVKTRLEEINFDARPELIERSVALVGSLRPEDLRDQRKKSLDIEKSNLETLLTQIQTSRALLETNVGKADALVEKIRAKFDKEIDGALADDKDEIEKNQ